MKHVRCETCGVQLALTSEILATAATEVARFVCGGCGASQECSYVKGRGTGARLWHATVEGGETLKAPFYLEGSAQ